MARKMSKAKPNPKTGSYTIRVPKSAITGKFVSKESRSTRIFSNKKLTK